MPSTLSGGTYPAVTDVACRTGVRVLTGGTPYTDGRAARAFLPPTVVELDGEDDLWGEELFGPVLVVRRAAREFFTTTTTVYLRGSGPLR